jgi:hypothetical protein
MRPLTSLYNRYMKVLRDDVGLRRARNGSVLLLVLVTLAFIGLLMPMLLRSLTLKNQVQNNFRSTEAMEAVVQAIAAKAVGELRELYRQYPTGVLPGAARYTQANPRVFPKGDPAFLIEVFQADGTPFAPRRFFAPETDARVWIARNGAGIGGNSMPLRIISSVCRLPLQRPEALPPLYRGGAQTWDPPCPANHTVPINYTGIVRRNNL